MDGFVVFLILLFIVMVPIVGIIRKVKQRRAREARIRALALSEIDNMNGVTFEHYVARLLRNEGYTKVEVSKGSGDFGVDIVASKDRRRYAIQVKRWTGTISRTAVSDAVAGQRHYSCNAAMVITNSYLSIKSKEFAASVGCEIVDRDILSEWILRFQGSAAGPRPVAIADTSAPESPPTQAAALLRNPPVQAPAEPTMPIVAVDVPSDVLQAIKNMAASDHPRDYSTQVFVITEQAEAYGKLQNFCPAGIPEQVLIEMLKQAAEDNPSDYSTQIFVLEENVQAYFTLVNFKSDDVPIETLAAIKEEAERDHPSDFSTQLFVVNDQIESFKVLGQLE